MKLWLLKRHEEDRPVWDTYYGHVARADNEEEARSYASAKAADEGSAVWLRPEKTSCVCIGDGEGERGLVLSDFCAG